jgi:hypothetical protein
LRCPEPPDVLPEHLDLAALWPQQPENVAQQDRLARARAADHAEHLARMHLEIEPVVHHLRPETGAQPADPHGGRFVRRGHRPSAENTIEKIASNTITRKMPTTTASVVLRPTLSALPSTLRPS